MMVVTSLLTLLLLLSKRRIHLCGSFCSRSTAGQGRPSDAAAVAVADAVVRRRTY